MSTRVKTRGQLRLRYPFTPIDKKIDLWLGRRKRDLYVVAAKGLVLLGYSVEDTSKILALNSCTVSRYLQADKKGYPPMNREELLDFLQERGVTCS